MTKTDTPPPPPSVRVLRDASGTYRIAHLSAVHPLPKKEDKADQSKVTAVHSILTMAGGQIHHTNLDYEKTAALCEDTWNALDGGTLEPV